MRPSPVCSCNDVVAPAVCRMVGTNLFPDTVRRVKLSKNSSDQLFGFYIRDGTTLRVIPHGLEKAPGIFISRLVPNGLAEGTRLLAVNDEIIEVNGIEVVGKSLDQVADLILASSQNMMILVKPATDSTYTPQSLSLRKSWKPVGRTSLSPSCDTLLTAAAMSRISNRNSIFEYIEVALTTAD